MKLFKRLFQKKQEPVKQAGPYYRKKARTYDQTHRTLAAELGREWKY